LVLGGDALSQRGGLVDIFALPPIFIGVNARIVVNALVTADCRVRKRWAIPMAGFQ
jgi:hypothetical protein